MVTPAQVKWFSTAGTHKYVANELAAAEAESMGGCVPWPVASVGGACAGGPLTPPGACPPALGAPLGCPAPGLAAAAAAAASLSAGPPPRPRPRPLPLLPAIGSYKGRYISKVLGRKQTHEERPQLFPPDDRRCLVPTCPSVRVPLVSCLVCDGAGTRLMSFVVC